MDVFVKGKASSDTSRVVALLKDVSYRDTWWFRLEGIAATGYGMLLQVCFPARENLQTGRKWYVSRFATDSEVVQTAFKAIVTAEEHEARERFSYKGRKVFGPHFAIDALVRACDES